MLLKGEGVGKVKANEVEKEILDRLVELDKKVEERNKRKQEREIEELVDVGVEIRNILMSNKDEKVRESARKINKEVLNRVKNLGETEETFTQRVVGKYVSELM